VSRPCIFTVLNLNEVYFPLTDIKLVSSAYISTGLSWVQTSLKSEKGHTPQFAQPHKSTWHNTLICLNMYVGMLF